MRDAWTTLRYRDGYAHDRVDRVGRIEITLWKDCRARIAHLARPNATPILFEGMLAPWFLPELFTHLASAGFPALQHYSTSAGDRMALMSIAAGASTLQAWILPAHRRMPAIDRALRLLEAVAHSLSGGTLLAFKPVEQGVLSR